jgi:hypothetical protein
MDKTEINEEVKELHEVIVFER